MSTKESKISVQISLKAKKGKESELASLLSSAAAIVKKTEPETLYWFATQIDANTFTINDGFASESGMQAHFNGQVAAALKARAEEVVEGGWENGILSNIVQSRVLSCI